MKKFIVFLFSITLIFSCEDIVSVPDISEDIVNVLAPSDGAILTSTEVTFSWEELAFADQYQVQVAEPSFESANQIVLDTILGDSLQSFRNFTKTLIPADSYQWRVRGLNSNFQTDYITQSFSIEAMEEVIVDLSDQMVTITEPVDDFETSETEITLAWEAIEEASLYRIIITDLSDNNIFLEQTVTTNSINVDFVTGMYSWAVRAENDTQNTPYTEQTITIL